MLTRARFLDEAATVDEKAALDLANHLAALRASAKVARERADKATPEERELLGARAEDLETDVIVSEAEITFKRRTASENRRVARELRMRAVKLVRTLKWTQRGKPDNMGVNTMTYWYSGQVKRWVLQDQVSVSKSGKETLRQRWELESFSVK